MVYTYIRVREELKKINVDEGKGTMFEYRLYAGENLVGKYNNKNFALSEYSRKYNAELKTGNQKNVKLVCVYVKMKHNHEKEEIVKWTI